MGRPSPSPSSRRTVPPASAVHTVAARDLVLHDPGGLRRREASYGSGKGLKMRLVPERLAKLLSRVPNGRQLVKRLRHPVAVQTLRATAAATIAYVIALHLSREPAP